MEKRPTENAKDIVGKPDFTLVPIELLQAVEKVRQYGISKYKERDNWRKVEPKYYLQAAYRHLLKIVENGIDSVDDESGLKHSWHLACNIGFIISLTEEMKPE